jgi:O-antigen ligase
MLNLILLLALYLPFQMALNPTEGVDLASIRVFVLIIFAFWLAKSLKNRKLVIKKGLISAAITVFLFINVVSIATSRNSEWSLRKILFFLSVFPIYFVSAAVITKYWEMEKVIKFLVWSGVAVALLGIVQFLLQFVIGLEKTYSFWASYIAPLFFGTTFSKAVLKNPSWLVNVSGKTILRATATFPDPHMLSFYLGLLIPLSLGLALKVKKLAYFLFFVALFICDILTFSRGGYLGLMAGFATVFFIFWGRFSLKYKAGSLLIAILALSVLFFPGPVSDRLNSSFDLKEGSNTGRLEMWKKASAVSLKNPILGVGLGNYPLEVKASAGYREPIYAHNTFLDIASETGIINAIFWFLILAVSIITFLKKSKSESLFLWIAVSVIIFSVHSLFETAIFSPTVLALFVLIISFVNIVPKNEKTS